MVERRSFIKTVGAATGLGLVGSGAAAQSDGDSDDANTVKPNERLVGTWSAAPVPPADAGPSSTGFSDQTLRQVVHTSVGGDGVRIRLTNQYGDRPVTFDRVTVGVRDAGASVVPGTTRTLTFGGEESVLVPAGAEAYSDPVRLDVAADQDLLVSLYTPDATGPATFHPLALHTAYAADGDRAAATGGAGFSSVGHSWFFLKGVDVVTRENVGTIVALGDSITDGFNSTDGADHTWPDYLARRLTERDDIHRSVVNAGISGNRVLHDSLASGSFGNNALARLDHDVLAQPGVTDVVLLEGINDIGQRPPAVSADAIIDGLRQIAVQLHARGINVFAGTLTPTYGSGDIYGDAYDSAAGEAKREAVNEFIRTSDVFDGVIDFDAAIRDPDRPDRMLPKYDSGDHLHPGDAGYEAMANAVDLSLFKGRRHARHPPTQ
ncbi:SGNH/GDSL hydrolase family protein [Halarchaeum sp. P4]|uniref:SGNH/GDSL hydrolase family protein n=1 Tax=Halarchaeum sp. P4 TaxID=3421639 RepID=UPI003EBD11C7